MFSEGKAWKERERTTEAQQFKKEHIREQKQQRGKRLEEKIGYSQNEKGEHHSMWLQNYGKTEPLILPWVKPVNVKYPHVAKRILISTETKVDTWMTRDHLATVGSSKEP